MSENMLFEEKRLTVEEKKENVFLRRRKITEKEKEDHLQEAGPSVLLFLRGWLILMIILRGQSIGMIICKRPVDPDDHLQEASRSG